LSKEYKDTAVRAAQILGLRVAGVDMLEGKDGPQVMEINSSPGLEGIETATKLDIADDIIEEIEHQVLFPEVDLRQRLTLSAGYGIAEFVVHNMPEMEDKTLREISLRKRNIQVISITRQKKPIPTPRAEEKIYSGDKLLCYGELRELRKLIPQQHPKPETRRLKKKTATKK
jgi:ribosomal protein S6--L-glutamate ligase